MLYRILCPVVRRALLPLVQLGDVVSSKYYPLSSLSGCWKKLPNDKGSHEGIPLWLSYVPASLTLSLLKQKTAWNTGQVSLRIYFHLESSIKSVYVSQWLWLWLKLLGRFPLPVHCCEDWFLWMSCLCALKKRSSFILQYNKDLFLTTTREMETFVFQCLFIRHRRWGHFIDMQKVWCVYITHVLASTCRVTHRLCAGKRSGNYPVLTYRFCLRQIPTKLSGSSAIYFLGNLMGMNNYTVNSMFILEGLTV